MYCSDCGETGGYDDEREATVEEIISANYNAIPPEVQQAFPATWPPMAKLVWWKSNSVHGKWPVELWKTPLGQELVLTALRKLQ